MRYNTAYACSSLSLALRFQLRDVGLAAYVFFGLRQVVVPFFLCEPSYSGSQRSPLLYHPLCVPRRTPSIVPEIADGDSREVVMLRHVGPVPLIPLLHR